MHIVCYLLLVAPCRFGPVSVGIFAVFGRGLYHARSFIKFGETDE